jgi:hypothetical protein
MKILNALNARSKIFTTGYKLTLLVILASLMSCATTLTEYKSSQPSLMMDSFFNGKLTAWGTFQDRNGKVLRRFQVEMIGTWDGNKGILDEDFVYDDGEKQKRIWRITKNSDGTFTGTADDVVGEAIGRSEGFALNWKYTMSLPVDDKVYDVQFNDWMYLVNTNNVINRASVTKYGFHVGEVTLFIQKQP